MSRMRSLLFGNAAIATASSGRRRYLHTFGGPHDRKGTSRDDCHGILIHLLQRLDFTDPAIPIAIPGARWLPFYYCFDSRANDLGYQLISDEALTVFFPKNDPYVTKHESWPEDDYPLEFPKSRIRITPSPYDPTNLDDAYAWAGIFGIGNLSKADHAAAKRRVIEEVEELGLGEMPTTEREFQEFLARPFIQGKPETTCLNPHCVNHRKKGQLTTIALMPDEPVDGVHLFGPWDTGTMLIVQMCNRCYTIRVSNQCT